MILLVLLLLLAELFNTLIHLLRDVLLVPLGNLPQDGDRLLSPALGHEPPAGLREEEGDEEDGDHLGEDDPVEDLPVSEIFRQPGLVDSTESEGHGQTNVTHQGPLVYRHVLQH